MMTRLVQTILASAAVAAAFIAGPAFAMQASDAMTQTTLTAEQLDALKSVLSGLPRQ